MGKKRIVVLSGIQKNRKFKIEKTLTIGRSPDNDIQVASPKASRFHAVVEETPAGPVIRDLSSRNGTFINDSKIKKCKLKPKDFIRIGDVKMKFVIFKRKIENTSDKGVKFKKKDDNLSVESASVQDLYQSFISAPSDSIASKNLKKTQGRLAALTEANLLISSERHLGTLFRTILNQIFLLTPAHNGLILIKNKETGDLRIECTKSGSGSKQFSVSTTIVNRTFDEGEALLSVDASKDKRFKKGDSIIVQNISSVMSVPLKFQGEKLGVIYINTHGTKNAFEQEDLELMVALSASAAVAIKNMLYLEEIEQAYHDTLVVTSNAIEMRDHYTIGHTWRVTNFALEIAKELGWDEDRLKLCKQGGVLHDVGKIAIKDSILNKPAALTEEEYNEVKIHPERGAKMMRDVSFLKPLIPYCLYHHERWDGKGYPHGLKGKDIPIEGRIIAVADTFDAMTSKRSYRQMIEPQKALAEIKQCGGAQFDPKIVKAFIKCYKKGKIEPLLQTYYKKQKNSIACPFCSTYSKFVDISEPGDIHECKVCHRRFILKKKGNKWLGELIAES